MMQYENVLKAISAFGLLATMGCSPALEQGTALVNTQPPKPTLTPVVSDATATGCAASDLQYLVGQPRTVLQTMRFGGNVRIEESGQVFRQDFIATRTRIVIDANAMIERIVCG